MRGKIVFIIAILILSMQMCAIPVKAQGLTDIRDFDRLTGEARYLGKQYKDNYYLDIEETGLLDGGKRAMNDIANIIFGFIKFLTTITVTIFYIAMDFDVGALIEPYLHEIHLALNEGVFKPFLIVVFIGTGSLILVNLLKRNLVGILTEIAKVIFVIVLSYFVVTDTSRVFTAVTNITKSISVESLKGLNGNMGLGSSTSYAADAAGILWVGMIHKPWLDLEFGNINMNQSTVDDFLTVKEGTKEREKLVKDYMKDNPSTHEFSKNSGIKRIPILLGYIFPLLTRCAIYLVVAAIQLAFQALAVFFVLFAPIVLLLSLVPGYDKVVGIWIRKIFETQLGIITVTFLMGFLIKLDILLFALIPVFGWFAVVILQVALGIGIYKGRNKILNTFSNIQKGVARPGNLRMQIMKSGDLFSQMESYSMAQAKKKSLNVNKKKTQDNDSYTSSSPSSKKKPSSSAKPSSTQKPYTSSKSESSSGSQYTSYNDGVRKRRINTEFREDERDVSSRYYANQQASYPRSRPRTTEGMEMNTRNIRRPEYQTEEGRYSSKIRRYQIARDTINPVQGYIRNAEVLNTYSSSRNPMLANETGRLQVVYRERGMQESRPRTIQGQGEVREYTRRETSLKSNGEPENRENRPHTVQREEISSTGRERVGQVKIEHSEPITEAPTRSRTSKPIKAENRPETSQTIESSTITEKSPRRGKIEPTREIRESYSRRPSKSIKTEDRPETTQTVEHNTVKEKKQSRVKTEPTQEIRERSNRSKNKEMSNSKSRPKTG